jgi:Derlin-2/3
VRALGAHQRDARPVSALVSQEWFFAVPPITRSYVTGAIVVTASCSLDLVSPFSLYFNLRLVMVKLQVWRLVTNFFFFGALGIDFLFHMFFLARYCRLLEEGSFRGRTVDFAVMLVFGGALM